MKISRENYEIWFVDWLDNRLSDEDIEELNFFLDRNPDLKEEFTGLFAINLRPDAVHSAPKEQLKRNLSAIPESQFEILCAAAAENDLDAEQKDELNEMISSDPRKSETLRIFRKLRLTPPAIVYINKRKLLRSTPAQKIVRIVRISLSAAAIIAIFLITGVLKQRIPSEPPKSIAENNTAQLSPAEDTQGPVSDPAATIAEKETEAPPSSGASMPVQTDSSDEAGFSQAKERLQVSVPGKIENTPRPEIAPLAVDFSIVPYTASYIPPKIHTDDGRSNVGRFITQHFRSGILKEKAPSDAPLKGYEIAEAGIDGLNKLLGWEMALTRGTDEKGEVKSLSFNSRMLKFNTPVKNNSPAE